MPMLEYSFITLRMIHHNQIRPQTALFTLEGIILAYSFHNLCITLQPSLRLTWLVEWNGRMCLLSANEMWSAGCQSRVYTTSSKFTVSRTELMAGMTPNPSWPAGQLRRARLPSRKSFCTSTTINAEVGCKIWKMMKKLYQILTNIHFLHILPTRGQWATSFTWGRFFLIFNFFF